MEQKRKTWNEVVKQAAVAFKADLITRIETTTDSYDVIARDFGVTAGYIYKLARANGLRRKADKVREVKTLICNPCLQEPNDGRLKEHFAALRHEQAAMAIEGDSLYAEDDNA